MLCRILTEVHENDPEQAGCGSLQDVPIVQKPIDLLAERKKDQKCDGPQFVVIHLLLIVIPSQVILLIAFEARKAFSHILQLRSRIDHKNLATCR